MAEGKTPNAEVGEMNESSIEGGGCPVRAPYPTESARTNESWWPKKLNLKILAKNPVEVDPFGGEFDYAAEFGTLVLASVKSDIEAVLTVWGPLIRSSNWTGRPSSLKRQWGLRPSASSLARSSSVSLSAARS